MASDETLGQKCGVKTECAICYVCDIYVGGPQNRGVCVKTWCTGSRVSVQSHTLVADSQWGPSDPGWRSVL